LLLAAVGCARPPAEPGETKLVVSEVKPFRLAVCSETFQTQDFVEICRATLRTGYTGLEIAPFNLSDDPASIPAERRREYRDTMASEGVEYIGLHSLLTVPRGALHVTAPDASQRRRSWDYFQRLIDLSADLGSNSVMVLGSGKQRAAADSASVQDAVQRLREGLAQVAPHAAERGVVILLEPLAPHLCNVITTLQQAVDLVDAVGHTSLRTMFDVHNTAGEILPAGELIRKHSAYIRHVHINEMDGRHPTTGSYDFSAPLQALKDLSYQGWVSLEVFQFEPSGEEIARISAEYLRAIERGLS
jgi:sugar phosphate isomerase/epimerase